jgi:hypothetical protein
VLAASPDYLVGSVHALTETGSLLIGRATGAGWARSYRAQLGEQHPHHQQGDGLPTGSPRSSSMNASASDHLQLEPYEQGGSWRQRGRQGGLVVAAAVDDAIDEQGGGAEYLAQPGDCRNANRTFPPTCCSTSSIASKACREYGHS